MPQALHNVKRYFPFPDLHSRNYMLSSNVIDRLRWIFLDAEAMKDVLKRALGALPRGGQTKIADALGIRPPTVNKWAMGYNLPEPKHWSQLEELLDLPAGTLVVGPTPRDDDRLDEALLLLAELRDRLDAVERKLGIRPRAPRSRPVAGSPAAQ